MVGLVLTAGGARGAYQAGILKRLGEVPGLRDGPSPFPQPRGCRQGRPPVAPTNCGIFRWFPRMQPFGALGRIGEKHES